MFSIALWAFLQQVANAWVRAEPMHGVWSGIVRPILGLAVAAFWAWGIAHMQGIYYWGWVAINSVALFTVAILLPFQWAGLLGSGQRQHWTSVSILEGLAILLMYVLLFSRPSLKAFWNRSKSRGTTQSVV